MGRKRKICLDDLKERTLYCACGRGVRVVDKAVESVICEFCASKVIPLRTQKQIEMYEKKMLEKEKQLEKEQDKNEKNHLTKNGKRRGRPPTKKNKTQNIYQNLAQYMKHEREKAIEENKSIITATQKSPEKTKLKTKKKQSKKKSKKGKSTMDTPKKGKRGRKATVGAKVMNFIQEQKSKVSFEDIFQVYSEERERIGKKNPDAVFEERNCRSTLYILVRDGKLQTTDKQFYWLPNTEE